MKRSTKQTLRLFIIISSLLVLVGCKNLNSRFGCDSTDYTYAKECPPLKFPPNALISSKRYDIPEIPNNNYPLIDDIAPPDYQKG